jgi:hypothetical protein
MDMIKAKQRQLDDSIAIATTADFENGSSAISNALSMMSLQSLITLLRNPQVKSKSQIKEWLAEVAAQYAGPNCQLLVETLGRRCHNW